MGLDKIDIEIIRLLSKDGRMPLKKIAKDLNVSTVTASNRVQKMKATGVIEGFGVKVDQTKLGYDLTAIINMTLKESRAMEVGKKLAAFQNIWGVYRVTGDFALTAIGSFKNRQHLQDFINKVSEIEEISNTHTNLILTTIKEDYQPSC